MANKYFTQLTQLTSGSVATGDALAIEDISAGETKYITAADLTTYLSGALNAGGWTQVSGTWTYLAASTITVPSGAASLYNKGDAIRWKQGGAYKYGNIAAVADTTLTIFVNTDYTVANSAITDMYYSKSANPLDFPTSFNYASTMSGSGGSIGTFAQDTSDSKYIVIGKECFVSVSKRLTNLGSWSGDIRTAIPVNSVSSTTKFVPGGMIVATGALTSKGVPALSAGGAGYVLWAKTVNTANLQWSDLAANDFVFLNFFYEY